MACGALTIGFAYDCANPIKSGISGEALYLFNLADWQAATITRTGNTITAITFPGAETGFAIEQPGTSNITSKTDYSREVGIPRFRHEVGFLIAANTPVSATLAETLGAGSYVACYITNDKQIMVLGEDSGLKMTEATIKDFAAAASSWTLMLASEEGKFEGNVPVYFVGSAPSNFNTTKTEFLALIA